MKTLIVAVVWATANLVAAVGGSGYLLGAVSRRLALPTGDSRSRQLGGAVATAIYKGQPAIAVVATIAWTCFCWWEHVPSKELTRVNTSGTVVDNSGGKSR